VKTELENRSVDKWQKDWNSTTKEKITKDYFTIVAEKLKMKILTTHKLTTMLTGYGKVNAYFHHFKITNTPTCPCGETDQTIYHLLYECDLLMTQRDALRSRISKSESWPISKHILITKYYKAFIKFTNKISFDNLH
jgi:hypothetical protein